jgi:hypothetical protein
MTISDDCPTLYVSITNHGFGHAARTSAVAGMVQELLPTVKLIIATTAPRWLVASYISGDFVYRPYGHDVGVIQADSLQMDLPATLTAWQQILDRQTEIINTEAAYLRSAGVDLVFADIPPLAPLIAHQAEVPCWAATNFGWDFIYRDWGAEFADLTGWIGDCYGKCDRMFHLPLSESLERFPVQEPAGLTGGTPRFSKIELQQDLGLNKSCERTILMVFGGLGLQAIPYHNMQLFPNYQFLTFDRDAPQLPNLLQIPDPSNASVDRRYRPVDIFPACDLVVSKPGYTTYAEAMIADLPVATIPRSGFAESAIIQAGLQEYSQHQMIESTDFFTGTWDFLNQPVQRPSSGQSLPKDGTAKIARSIVDFLTDR